jgi:hypothetical protein
MRRHLTYSNVISTLCLILVVGGGVAYAANTVGSSDVINNSLRSVDLKDNDVQSTDVQDGSLTGDDVASNSISGTDITNNGIKGADVASNSLDTLDINESSLVLNDHFSAAAAPNGSCFDDDHNGDVCASTTFNLERSGRVLMNASGNWRTTALNDTSDPGADTDDSTAVAGTCALRIDGNSISAAQRMGEKASGGPSAPAHAEPFNGTFALTDMTDSLPAGSHSVQVFCVELDGDLDWSNIRLTAARVDN